MRKFVFPYFKQEFPYLTHERLNNNHEEWSQWWLGHSEKNQHFYNSIVKVANSKPAYERWPHSGFFQKHFIIAVPAEMLQLFIFRPVAYDGRSFTYFYKDEAKLGALLRAEARPLQETDVYHLASFFNNVLFDTDDSQVLSSEFSVFRPVNSQQTLNFDAVGDWLGKIPPPTLSGDQFSGWRLEFATHARAAYGKNPITRYCLSISPDFSIHIEKEVLTSNTYLKFPNPLY